MKSTLQARLAGFLPLSFQTRIQQFSPIWFTVNMGTGAASTLLLNLPLHFRGQKEISEVIFGINCVMLILFTIMFTLRCLIFPFGITKAMIHHPLELHYLGTMPMGFATAINYAAFVYPQAERAISILWYLNVVFSLSSATVIPYIMFTRHSNSLATINAVMIQPIVSLVICAAVGSVVADIQTPAIARGTIVICYSILGLGFFPMIFLNAAYLARLIVHGLPPKSMIFTSFLPVGPFGQTAFALIQSAVVLRKNGLGDGIFNELESESMTLALYAVSLVAGLLLFGGGLFWVLTGSFAVIEASLKARIPFGLGYWGCTFSISTLASAAVLIYNQTQLVAFKVIGSFISILVLILWLFIFLGTVYGFFEGSIVQSQAFEEYRASTMSFSENESLGNHEVTDGEK